MKSIGEITIKVEGMVGNETLSPDNYDIFNLPQVVESVKDMLFPNGKSKSDPTVTYEMRNNCVLHVFKTTMQKVVEFGAVLSLINTTSSLDLLESKTARAFESIQAISRQQGCTFSFSTSEQQGKPIVVIAPSTNLSRSENAWAKAEFYFYGKLTDAGGKDKANIHLDTEKYGLLTISVEQNYLHDIKVNPLYRFFAVRASGRQNAITGEIDFRNLKLIDITDYQTKFDEEYLDGLIKKATPHFDGVDVDAWLSDLRGGVYA